MDDLIENEDYYSDGPFMVFTSMYHLKRGYCCGSGCRHCPYEPRHVAGGTNVAEGFRESNKPALRDASENEPRH